MSVTRQATTVAIFRQRNPSGEQRPDATLVITDGVIKAHARAQIARSPVGRELRGCPAFQHRPRARQIERSIPGGYRGINCRTCIQRPVGVAAESVKLRIWNVVFLLDLL